MTPDATRPSPRAGRLRAARGVSGRRPPRVVTIPIPTPFPVGAVNVHAILGEPVTLVDTGPLTDSAWEALRSGLARHGLTPADVKQVFLTHGHHDHFGLAEKVAEVSGARLLGGRLDRRHFAMRRRGRLLLDQLARADFGLRERFVVVASVAWVDRFARPLRVWDELSGGESFAGDGWSLSVRATPGHTPGSLTFEIPEAGLLFTGDTVLHRITPNAVVDADPERPGELFRSLSRYVGTLEAIEATNAGSTLLTGHGVPIADFPSHRKGILDRYARRVRAIEQELSGGPRTVRELAAALFPRARHVNVYLAYSEVMGFLMYLEDLGRVERLAGGRLDRYRWRSSSPASR